MFPNWGKTNSKRDIHLKINLLTERLRFDMG